MDDPEGCLRGRSWTPPMRVDVTRVGAKVKVSDDHARPDLAGQKGTVMRAYRSSSGKTALHVSLDDGRWQLLWPHEVEQLGEERG